MDDEVLHKGDKALHFYKTEKLIAQAILAERQASAAELADLRQVAQGLREEIEIQDEQRSKLVDLHLAEENRLQEQITKLEKANLCSWCGSNDLVCGKAWKEERDGKVKEIADLRAKLSVATEALNLVIKNCSAVGMVDPFNCGWRWFYRCQDALAQIEGTKGDQND
jgi:hypothetical protein